MGFFLERMDALMRPILEEDEKVVLRIKQSLLSDIAPSFIIATDRRLIVINNSFWGLYLGHNIAAPTDYNTMAYRQITSVVLVKGKLFSTVDLRLIGGFESRISPQKKTEGEIDGLRDGDGEVLMKHIEKMISTLRIQEASRQQTVSERGGLHPDPEMHLKLYYAFKGVLQDRETQIEELDLGQAKKMVNEKDAKFVWLGSESKEFIGKLLGVSPERIVKMDPDDIKDMDKAILDTLHGYIFVCYNGNLAGFVAKYLKKEHKIRSYNLKGGLVAMAKSCDT